MSSAKPSKCRRWTPVQTSRPSSGRPVGFFMIRIRGHGWPQNSLSSWGSGLHVFCHQVCTLIRDSLYYFEQRWWCPRFRGTFCSWCIPTFTACDLATQGSSSSGFWALCAPLLKSLDVKKNTGSSCVIRSRQCRPYKRQSPFITLYNPLFKYRLRNRRTFQCIDKSVKIFWCINLIYLYLAERWVLRTVLVTWASFLQIRPYQPCACQHRPPGGFSPLLLGQNVKASVFIALCSLPVLPLLPV